MGGSGLAQTHVAQYFHDSVLSGHLGARKTFQKIAANF
jgi:hypothetical protein